MKKQQQAQKTKSQRVNVMGSDVVIPQRPTAYSNNKVAAEYTSNEDAESYENDFQSDVDGPFTAAEQQWQEQLIQSIQDLESSFESEPLTTQKLDSMSQNELKSLLIKKKETYDLHRQYFKMLNEKK